MGWRELRAQRLAAYGDDGPPARPAPVPLDRSVILAPHGDDPAEGAELSRLVAMVPTPCRAVPVPPIAMDPGRLKRVSTQRLSALPDAELMERVTMAAGRVAALECRLEAGPELTGLRAELAWVTRHRPEVMWSFLGSWPGASSPQPVELVTAGAFVARPGRGCHRSGPGEMAAVPGD